MANKFVNLVRAADPKALGGPMNKFILWMIADQANGETGLAWPGDKKLAREAGCSTRTVKKATKKLREIGALIEASPPSSAHGRARAFRIGVSFLEFVLMTLKGATPVGEESSPDNAAEIGEKYSPPAGFKDEVATATWVKSERTPCATDDAQDVKTATVMGAWISPLPSSNPNLKPPRQPQGPRSSKEEMLKRLRELHVLCLVSPPKLLAADDLIQEGDSIVEYLDTDEARDLWEGFLSRCLYPSMDDDDDSDLYPSMDDDDSGEAKATECRKEIPPLLHWRVLSQPHDLVEPRVGICP